MPIKRLTHFLINFKTRTSLNHLGTSVEQHVQVHGFIIDSF